MAMIYIVPGLHRRHPHAGAGHARHPRPGRVPFLGPLDQLSWACLCCGRLVTPEREVAHLLRRITASVSLPGSAAARSRRTTQTAPRRHGRTPSNQALAHHSVGRTS